MILVYSSGRVPADLRPEGASYRNPSFFQKAEPGVTMVYLNGDLQKVRTAYERAGVPVVDLRSRSAPVAPLDAPAPPERAQETLPAFSDLPADKQAEVTAVLDDDEPFEGMTTED